MTRQGYTSGNDCEFEIKNLLIRSTTLAGYWNYTSGNDIGFEV